MLNGQKFEKWQRWMKRIQSDVALTATNHAIFQSFNLKVMRGNRGHIDKVHAWVFFGFVKRCYIDTAISGVRRQVKPQAQSVSLKGLLEEIAAQSDDFSFDFYKTVQDNPYDWMDWRWGTFRSFSYGRQTISRRLVEGHLTSLEKAAKNVEHVADRRVSHLDSRGVTARLPYGELVSAIKTIDRLACKYAGLINGAGLSTLGAALSDDWMDVFLHPMRGN